MRANVPTPIRTHRFSSFSSLSATLPPLESSGQVTGERQRGESNPLPVFPIRWERESAFSSVSRGLDGAGLLAGTGGRTRRELVYGTARLEINVHDTPSTILFNGGFVEENFVHVYLWVTVFLIFRIFDSSTGKTL